MAFNYQIFSQKADVQLGSEYASEGNQLFWKRKRNMKSLG